MVHARLDEVIIRLYQQLLIRPFLAFGNKVEVLFKVKAVFYFARQVIVVESWKLQLPKLLLLWRFGISPYTESSMLG